MKYLKYLLIFILLAIITVPLSLFFSWKMSNAKNLDMLIVDKTVLRTEAAEHRSVMWVLNNNRFLKSNNKPYSLGDDYYGFKPLKPYSGKKYEIKSIAIEQIDSLAQTYDIAYFTDTYGVFFNEWHNMSGHNQSSSIIYGGLNQNDYLFIREMLNNKKPVISEFNLLGYPTSPLTSYKAQQFFRIKWTGWTGCYFETLDQQNNELPKWIVNLYKDKNDGEWPFDNGGVVLVKNGKKIIVLEEGSQLSKNGFKIESSASMAAKYGIPTEIPGNSWFDIIIPENSNYEIISNFTLDITHEARNVLKKHGLSTEFPAAIYGGDQFPFYYFSGDFSENEMPYYTAYLKGIKELDGLFYAKGNGRKQFFWKYYVPLLSSILDQYTHKAVL